jgi:hypothetical protein
VKVADITRWLRAGYDRRVRPRPRNGAGRYCEAAKIIDKRHHDRRTGGMPDHDLGAIAALAIRAVRQKPREVDAADRRLGDHALRLHCAIAR